MRRIILGTYKDLQASGLDFTNLLGEHTEEDKEESELIRQGSIRSVASCEIEEPKEVEEQKSSGSVGAYVYRAYFKAGGNCCAILTLFSLFIIAQLFGSAADYFITYWYVSLII